MKYSRSLFAAAVLYVSVATAASAAADRIVIAAAADLKFAMDEIVASFRAFHPGDSVNIVYGSSENIRTQIERDAPFDVFFSADIGFANELKAKGLATTEPKLYAVGRIVLWSAVRDASKMSLQNLDDPKLENIAIADPRHAPYGKRAEEALRAAGLWEKVQNKLVLGENIAQTTQFVQTGAAEIGIIALSLAVNPELASRGGYALIPDNLHSPLEQAYVITTHGGEHSLAIAFAQYIETPDTRRIMVKYGFVLPDDTVTK
jgi:molybdate transport system substrate-binding protein